MKMFVKNKKDEEYDLKASSERLCQIVPCIVSKSGELIDGNGRRRVDPDWWTVKNPAIDSAGKVAAARLVVNLHRRVMDFQEKRELLGECMRLNKWDPPTAAKELGMTRQWVYKHMPTDLLKRDVLHKRVDSKRRLQSDRITESRALATLMNEIDGEDPNPEVVGALQSVDGGPLLPFPDCKCSSCPHVKECRFLWG